MNKEEFLKLRPSKQAEWLTITTCKLLRSIGLSSAGVEFRTTDGRQNLTFKICMSDTDQICCNATHVMLFNADTGREASSHYGSKNRQATLITCALILSVIPNEHEWIKEVADYYRTISLYSGKRFSSAVTQSVPYM